jgi:phosphoribosylformylglycinamidine cyclo-ligase
LLDHDGVIKGLAHITGGGLVENIPRILPSNVDVVIKEGSWPVLPVYHLLERIGNVPREEMRRTFNLGIGMVVIIAPENIELVKDHLTSVGEKYHLLGDVAAGNGQVQFA